MIRINLMPFEERSQKARRPQAARKSGGVGAMLLPIAIIVLRADSNAMEHLAPLVPSLLAALSSVTPRTLVTIAR